MAWERRGKSGPQFYYRGVRRGGRVVKHYLGPASDPVANVLARQDRLARAERLAAKAAIKAEREAYRQAESLLITLQSIAQTHIRAGLLAQGFRWAPRRGFVRPQGEATDMPDVIAAPTASLPTRDEFDALVDRAQRGSHEALQDLRSLLRGHPEIGQAVGDIADQVREMLIDKIAGASTVTRESIRIRLEEVRSDLGFASASALERLAIEQVVMTWIDSLHVHAAAARHDQARGDEKYWQERLQAAQKRHTAAMEGLARMQKLLAENDG